MSLFVDFLQSTAIVCLVLAVARLEHRVRNDTPPVTQSGPSTDVSGRQFQDGDS